jgi:hypothetical protein
MTTKVRKLLQEHILPLGSISFVTIFFTYYFLTFSHLMMVLSNPNIQVYTNGSFYFVWKTKRENE